MLKLISFNLLIITFVLISCSKSEEADEKTASTIYANSKSGDTASGSITVGSDTLTGTYKGLCASTSTMSSYPSDATHVGFVIVITGSSSYTKEMNYYTDSACTSLSLGWYFNFDNVTVGDASGSDYKITANQASHDILANTSGGETFIESLFSNQLDVTVGTEKTTNVGTLYYNLINISGTTLSFGDESDSAYSSSSSEITFKQQ